MSDAKHTRPTAPADSGWRRMDSAPKDATDVLLKVPDPSRLGGFAVKIGHWAEDLSGSEQPPFRGWFENLGSYMSGIQPEPIQWAPLPGPASPDAPDLIGEAVKVMEQARDAMTVLHSEATSFNVSGVYFDEACMEHKGPALVVDALEAARDFIAKAKIARKEG